MTTSNRNPKVDGFLRKASKWKAEFEQLRAIVLDCGLTEDFKWMHPCYTLDHKNIVLIHGFKAYCALLFHKGALLQDPRQLLVQQTANVQAARQLRFTSLQEIADQAETIKAYILEAIEVEMSGLAIEFKKTTEYAVPEEFQSKLDELPGLKTAFESLTPGRQKGYLIYFAAPKQAKTREARIEKSIAHILEGKGLDD